MNGIISLTRSPTLLRMLEIYDAGSPDEQALGQWMRQMGLGA